MGLPSNVLVAGLGLLWPFGASAQTTALDFDLVDCEGVGHHLFAELDAGNVVILEFPMVACTPCIEAGHALQNVLDAHESTEPGVVKWYAWGYSDTYTCAMLEEWETDNGLSPSGTLVNGMEQVAYYGGMGMPTIVVLAGSDHRVLLTQQGYIPSTQSHVEDAVASALTIGLAEQRSTRGSIEYDPRVGSLVIKGSAQGGGEPLLRVVDSLGRVVLSISVGWGSSVPVGLLASGPYSAVLVSANGMMLDRLCFVRG